jgi:hypothetical protein
LCHPAQDPWSPDNSLLEITAFLQAAWTGHRIKHKRPIATGFVPGNGNETGIRKFFSLPTLSAFYIK